MTAPACGSCAAPTGDGAVLCTGCTRDLAGLLLLAASIAGDLDDAVAKLLKRGSGGKRGDENPLPVDLAASEAAARLRGALLRMVTEYVTDIREYPGCGIAIMARWLLPKLTEIRQHYDAPPELAMLRNAVRDALAVIDRKPERAPAGLCDNCGRQLLAELGADEVRCACGMTVLALQDKRRERAAAADVLGTPAELSAVLASLGYRVAPGTISGWGTLGRIERRAGGVYRLSEALHMASKTGTRRARVGG